MPFTKSFVAAPFIPWLKLRGFRALNAYKLIHDYFGVDLEIVWDTVQQDLVLLEVVVAGVLAQAAADDQTIS